MRLYYKVPPEHEILQLENLSSQSFHSSINENIPIIIPNLEKIDTRIKTNKLIIENSSRYKIPFIKKIQSPITIITKQSVSVLPKNNYRNLVSTDFDRNFYYVTKGTVRFYIFHPKYKSHLYPNNTYDSVYKHSDYNMFRPDIKKYPNTKHAKYIEIIVRENTLLFIPRFYWYCYKSDSDSVLINIKTETIFSFIINIKNILSHIKYIINKRIIHQKK